VGPAVDLQEIAHAQAAPVGVEGGQFGVTQAQGVHVQQLPVGVEVADVENIAVDGGIFDAGLAHGQAGGQPRCLPTTPGRAGTRCWWPSPTRCRQRNTGLRALRRAASSVPSTTTHGGVGVAGDHRLGERQGHRAAL